MHLSYSNSALWDTLLTPLLAYIFIFGSLVALLTTIMFALIDRKPSGRTIVALLGAAVILGVGLVVRGASLYLNPANLSNAGIVPMAIVALAVIFAELDNRFSKRVKIIYSVGLVLYLVLLLIFVFA